MLFLSAFGAIFKKKKIVAKTNVKEVFPYIFFKEFYGFSCYICVFSPFRVNFYLQCKISIQFHSFAYGYPVPSTIHWRDHHFPMVYSWHSCQGFLTVYTWVYPWDLYSVHWLVYVSIFIPVLYCFDYYIFLLLMFYSL